MFSDHLYRVRGPLVRAVVILALVGTAGACTKTSSSLTTGPSQSKCQVALTGPSSVESVGGVGFVTIATQPECAWTVSTPSTWISELAPASGQGSGRFEFRAAANPSPTVREGEIAVNDDRLRVTQQAAPCSFTLAPTTQTIAAAGGTGGITITTTAGCTWSATSNATWLTVTGSTTGTASGTVTFAVTANTGTGRSATITVGGQQATVQQSGTPGPAPCDSAIAPVGQSFGAPGGASSPISVTAAAGCAWTARSTDAWITVTGGATGTGNGTVTFSVAANSGAARTGTITIAGQTFTVNQEALPVPPTCSIAIAPESQSVGHTSGTGTTIAVTTGPPCAWTATRNVGWLTVLTGASGTGNGTVTFRVDANTTGIARTGSLTIGGRTFAVEQAAAPCTYTLNPSRIDSPASGNTGAGFQVQALPGCTWSATSTAPWIAVTVGGSGSGNGVVSFNVSANPGAARSGTVTVVGQAPTTTVPFTVNQTATSCTFSLTATSSNQPAAATTNQSVDVTANQGTCAWTATSNAPWLTITAGASGSGSGPVRYNVGPNTGLGRTGTLTIAGHTFTVNQAGCAYALSPASQNHPLAGATGRYVGVTNPAGCTSSWTATSNVPWLAIDPPRSGTGAGSITYTVGATSTPRGGTMTIAGQTFTVSQP